MQGEIRVSRIADGVDLRRGADGKLPRISLRVLGATGRVYWLVDGRLQQSGALPGEFTHRFTSIGPDQVTAVDASGSHSTVALQVQ